MLEKIENRPEETRKGVFKTAEKKAFPEFKKLVRPSKNAEAFYKGRWKDISPRAKKVATACLENILPEIKKEALTPEEKETAAVNLVLGAMVSGHSEAIRRDVEPEEYSLVYKTANRAFSNLTLFRDIHGLAEKTPQEKIEMEEQLLSLIDRSNTENL